MGEEKVGWHNIRPWVHELQRLVGGLVGQAAAAQGRERRKCAW